MKRRLLITNAFLTLLPLALLFFGRASVTYANPPTSTTAAAPCTYSTTSFFGILPTWYVYLPPQLQTNPNGTTFCAPTINSILDIWLIVAAVIEIILRLAGVAAVIMILYGGIRYTTSMGNPEAVVSAKNTIIYALVGLLIAIAASLIITFMATTFGAS